jgi:hypothetical protein
MVEGGPDACGKLRQDLVDEAVCCMEPNPSALAASDPLEGMPIDALTGG